MPRALAEEIARDMWTRSDGQGEVMLSGQNCGYLMERGLGMLDRILEIGNRYQIIHDPSEVPEDIVKVSVYLHEGVEKYADRFVPRWQQANCAVAGPYWIDTTLANKGTGVRALCGALGIDPGAVLAFGDNYNDTAMLDLVGLPYIMDSAAAVRGGGCAQRKHSASQAACTACGPTPIAETLRCARCWKAALRKHVQNGTNVPKTAGIWTDDAAVRRLFDYNIQKTCIFLAASPLTVTAEYGIINMTKFCPAHECMLCGYGRKKQ